MTAGRHCVGILPLLPPPDWASWVVSDPVEEYELLARLVYSHEVPPAVGPAPATVADTTTTAATAAAAAGYLGGGGGRGGRGLGGGVAFGTTSNNDLAADEQVCGGKGCVSG